MFLLNQNKQKTCPNSLKESTFGYFSENLGLFWFVTKQFCLFRFFRFWFHETNQNKPETNLVSVCFGSNRNLFLFVSRTPYPPPIQLGKGGPLEGVDPETHVHKTHNIHYRIQNTEYRIQNTESSIQNTEYRIQNTEYRIQNTEFRIQNTEYRIQNTEYRIQNTGYRIQNTEYRIQNTEYRIKNKECRIQNTEYRNSCIYNYLWTSD
jgi:hypothetical protein